MFSPLLLQAPGWLSYPVADNAHEILQSGLFSLSFLSFFRSFRSFSLIPVLFSFRLLFFSSPFSSAYDLLCFFTRIGQTLDQIHHLDDQSQETTIQILLRNSLLFSLLLSFFHGAGSLRTQQLCVALLKLHIAYRHLENFCKKNFFTV
jgi:hypothetical protein